MLSATLCLLLLGGTSDETFMTWEPAAVTVDQLPATIGTKLSAQELSSIASGQPVLPYHEARAGVRTEDGTLLVATEGGLCVLRPGAERWCLVHSRRWLPSDDVQDVAVDREAGVWVKTAAGLGHLARRSTTLDEKMAEINAAIQQHHLRDGQVGDISVKEPGNLDAGYFQHSSDNDGLWTSIYVAAEAFRYGATGDETARDNAWKSLQAMMFMEDLTGIPGFVARSFVPISDDPKRYGGEWYKSADGKWWWKGDTSSDELDGHYFAYAVYYDCAATEEQKKIIRGYVQRITDHLLDHGYYYVGPPGKPTTWGVFAPEKLNHDLKWIADRGLNSLEILSHLKVAEHIVGGERYTKALEELDQQHAYPINTVLQKMTWPPEEVNHSDDELAFLAYYPLVLYEHDPELRKLYMASLHRSFEIERPEHSPLFNYIYAAGRQTDSWKDPGKRPPEAFVDPASYDHDLCVEWFREVPRDTFDWKVRNSKRRDLGVLSVNRFDRARMQFVLPIAERRVMRWNGDPYELDAGGDGRSRDDGAFIVLPYWMGRYHRFLD
ncbi:MAG: hypothetical protein KF708_13085 [Pirellulales bacterium]|nr:hypothetical protein [Pirellulales bacterium]